MAWKKKPRALLLTGFEAVVVVTLALLAMANPGSPKPGGGGPAYSGGFSSGSWDGSTPLDQDHYKFAIIDASVGTMISLCSSYSTAVYSHFADAAQAVHSPGDPVHAFWFLISNYRASQPRSSGGCGLNLTPYQWGETQADWFLFCVATTCGSGTVSPGTVSQMFGDVEIIGSGPACTAPDGTYLPSPDGPMWLCDTPAHNRDVIKGFADTLKAGHYNEAYNGVYTGRGAWPQIVNGAESSSVGTEMVWMASMCASQGQLNDQAQYFRDRGFYIFSWQYVINDSSIPGCATCALTYSTAESQAKNAPVYIPRWDVWTNSSPNTVCQ
jgi:hypothetical protein